MIITLEPTPVMHTQALEDGQQVPLRIWQGTTDSGILIEAYVFAIAPEYDEDSSRLRAELPAFMRPAREQYKLVVPDK